MQSAQTLMQELMTRMQRTQPELMTQYNATLNAYVQRAVQCETVATEDCPHRKCDGSGYVWLVDYDKKHHLLTGSTKYHEIERTLRQQAAQAKQQGDEAERARLLQEADKALIDEWQERCSCYQLLEQKKQIKTLFGESQMPEKFAQTDVTQFNVEIYKHPQAKEIAFLAKTMAAAYVKQFEKAKVAGKGMYLFSRTKGAGKTRLACAIGNELMTQHNQAVLYVKATDISLQIRATYGDSEKTEEDVLRIYRNVDVLIIDDFITEGKSEFNEKILYQIIDHRMEQKKITLITSNIEIEEISKYYPDPNNPSIKGRLESRINQICMLMVLPEESIRDDEARTENDQFAQMLLLGE